MATEQPAATNDNHRFGLEASQIAAIRDVFTRHPDIEQAIVYGSRAKGDYRPWSDIDITLLGEQLDFSTLLQIENELDDLLLPYKIDLSLYHHIDDEPLLAHIRRVGKVLYEKS